MQSAAFLLGAFQDQIDAHPRWVACSSSRTISATPKAAKFTTNSERWQSWITSLITELVSSTTVSAYERLGRAPSLQLNYESLPAGPRAAHRATFLARDLRGRADSGHQ